MQDVNLDSFCEELLQQSSDAGPAGGSFDVSNPLLPFLQRICSVCLLYYCVHSHVSVVYVRSQMHVLWIGWLDTRYSVFTTCTYNVV